MLSRSSGRRGLETDSAGGLGQHKDGRLLRGKARLLSLPPSDTQTEPGQRANVTGREDKRGREGGSERGEERGVNRERFLKTIVKRREKGTVVSGLLSSEVMSGTRLSGEARQNRKTLEEGTPGSRLKER